MNNVFKSRRRWKLRLLVYQNFVLIYDDFLRLRHDYSFVWRHGLSGVYMVFLKSAKIIFTTIWKIFSLMVRDKRSIFYLESVKGVSEKIRIFNQKAGKSILRNLSSKKLLNFFYWLVPVLTLKHIFECFRIKDYGMSISYILLSPDIICANQAHNFGNPWGQNDSISSKLLPYRGKNRGICLSERNFITLPKILSPPRKLTGKILLSPQSKFSFLPPMRY